MISRCDEDEPMALFSSTWKRIVPLICFLKERQKHLLTGYESIQAFGSSVVTVQPSMLVGPVKELQWLEPRRRPQAYSQEFARSRGASTQTIACRTP